MYLQPGNPNVDPAQQVDPADLAARLDWLVSRTLSDHWYAPKILPQLHVMLWGNKRGV
jgi:7-carboxy-7-deazaguanine synthase